jgi:hypothetical protein
MDVKERLFLRIRQACPLAIGFDWRAMRIDFDPAATVEQRAAAQAILEAFDPVQEQAAVEAEEKAKAEHAAFLATLTPKMITDIKVELAAATTKIAELEAKVSVAPK